MSQLADGVQKLLHTNREGEGRERSMSQQTLQHLETLQSQQLQLQSQLLESALKIVTGHASVTCHASASANGVRKPQASSSATGSPAAATTAMETAPITMETCSCEHGQKKNRDCWYLQNKCVTENSYPPSVACHSQEAVRRANEMLKKMGRLNTDMKMLLTQPEDSPPFSRPAPDPHQAQQHQPQLQQQKSQQDQFQTHQNSFQQSYPLHYQPPKNYSQNNHFPFQPFQDQHRESHMNRSQHLQSNQNQSQSQNLQSSQTKSQQNSFPSPHSLFHQIQSQGNHIHETQSQSALVHKRSVGPSLLEEAGQVLRQAQRQKKVLEENLEALLKAKTGEILHCQLEALAANRDWTEEVQIKKTVDTWINTLSSDFQAEKSSVDAAGCRSADTGTPQQRAAGRGRPLSMLRATGTKPGVERGSRGQRAGHKTEAESDRGTGKLTNSQQVQVDRQSYLNRMYGKVPYEGLRRTLKKSPYLHFNSPASPLSRKPCPRLVESIRGVRLKSCKTQTSLTPPPSLSPGHPQHHHVFSSSHRTPHDPAHHTMTLADSSPVAMAIPLGRPRMDSSSKCERTPEVASVLTAPLSTTAVTMDNTAPEEQNQLDANKAPSAPSPILVILERDCKEDKEDEEESIYPGTDSLYVPDIMQEQENELGNGALVLNGHPSPTPVLYHGPAFPSEALSSHPAQETPVLGTNPQQDVLENRLVEWVSQQLMSRMIADIYHPPISDPAQNEHSTHSELEEQSLTSDIVEAAGGGGLQLFVDSNVSVDSDLIRKLVNEALTETVAQVLGQKDALDAAEEPGWERPEPGAHDEEELVSPVPTPVPTPLPRVAQPSRETPPVTTPPPSEPSSPLNEEPPLPIPAAEPVTTPTTTPEPHVSEGNSSLPAPSWGDPELTEEERPEEHVDPHRKQLVMLAAEEEPALCPPFGPPPLSPAPSLPAPAEGTPGPPSSSTEDSSSSSSTVTAETEAALKHISEGELLISATQLAPLTEEEAFGSFSSSLQELQDMDLDPPTAEQINGHNLLLTLLAKMDQGVTPEEKRLRADGSWGMERETEEEMSVGEVRDCETPKPRKNQASPSGQSSQNAAGQQEKEQGGRRKMKDLMPCSEPREEVEEDVVIEVGEPLSAAADTDSSTNDVF